jgi:hypothetical protein
MSATTFTAAQTLRAEQGSLSDRTMVPSLWRAVRGEWQRRQDRAAARNVHWLDHPGVSEDFRMACRGR